ncbi:MAG: complex I subunit 5 family protein [Bacilli bacterium]
MSLLIHCPLLSIITCFICVVLCSLLPRKGARICAYISQGLCLLLGIGTLIYTLKNGTTIYQMGHLSEVEGDTTKYYWYNNVIRFGVIEGILASFFPLVLFLALNGGLANLEQSVNPNKEKYYYVLTNLVLVSLLALIYTDDTFTGYVFLEISTLASIGLVAIKNKGKTTVAAIRYLIFNLVGSGLFLIGIVLLYDMTGYFMFEKIQIALSMLPASSKMPISCSFALITIGLGIKSGLFPFYFWMPDTYGESTTASASIISGFISKGYIILLIKFITRVFGFRHTYLYQGETITVGVVEQTGILDLLFILGALGMILGSISAIIEKRINKMIAFSSAAQIGYIYLALGMGEAGIACALFQILTHAVTKPLLFTSAYGLIEASSSKTQFKYLRNAGRRNVLAGIGFTVGALSMIGFPFFAGFVVKYVYVQSALETSVEPYKLILVIVSLVVSTLLNTIYFISNTINIYSNPSKEEMEKDIIEVGEKQKNKLSFIISVCLFIVLNIALGSIPLIYSIIQQEIINLGMIFF